MHLHKASPSLVHADKHIILSTTCMLPLLLLATCRQPQHPQQESSQLFFAARKWKLATVTIRPQGLSALMGRLTFAPHIP